MIVIDSSIILREEFLKRIDHLTKGPDIRYQTSDNRPKCLTVILFIVLHPFSK